MKFRNKILLAIFGVVFGFLVVIFAIANYWMRVQVEARFATDIKGNYTTIREISSFRQKTDIQACENLAELPRLKAVADLGDKNTALNLSRELNNSNSSDLFILKKENGAPLVELLDGKESDEDLSLAVPTSQTNRNAPIANTWNIHGRIYRGATAPVIVGADVVGMLTIGYHVTREDVAFIQSMTNSEVKLVSDTSIIYASSEDPGKEDIEHWLRNEGMGFLRHQTSSRADIVTIKGGADKYVAAMYRLNLESDSAAIVYLFTRQIGKEVRESMAPVMKAFFILSIVVLIVTAVIGFVISSGITRPIALLVRGTTEIAKGNYDYRISIRSEGELKFLAMKFEEMSSTLKEKISQLAERNVELESTLNRLSNTELRLQTILDTSSAIISVKDIQGKYLLINKRFEILYNFKRAEIIGKTDYDLFPKSMADELRAKDQKAISSEKSLEWEEEATRNDVVHTYITNRFPLYDSAGTPYAVCGFSTDISDRKRLEEGLRQAQKMESIGTLAGGIAHDFNNILGIIFGYISRLERGKVTPDKMPESLDGLRKASQRGADLVKQILTFARKTDVLLESVNLNNSIEEFTKMLSETFPKTVVFKLNLDRHLPSIIADAGQIQQTLLNFCVNARDAMPNGGTISITTRVENGEQLVKKFSEADQRPYACIEIADSGTGMDEATMARIFEPFFTTKELGRGTGLGLSVVFGIIKSHRGFVDVQSTVGHGTTFFVYFPIPPGFIGSSKIELKEKDQIKGGTETILLVEDEEVLRELVKSAIEEKGYTVIVANDGVQAVNLFMQYKESIALVLCDMGLPKMGGWDVYKRVKELKQNTKVIFASGYFDPALKIEMIKSGAVDFIQKPYNPEEIVKHIRDVIDKSRN